MTPNIQDHERNIRHVIDASRKHFAPRVRIVTIQLSCNEPFHHPSIDETIFTIFLYDDSSQVSLIVPWQGKKMCASFHFTDTAKLKIRREENSSNASY